MRLLAFLAEATKLRPKLIGLLYEARPLFAEVISGNYIDNTRRYRYLFLRTTHLDSKH